MPLLNRVEHAPAAGGLPPGVKAGDEVFLLRCSSEVVKSYGDYVAKQQSYAAPVWQDKYWGKAGLTYQAALALEKNAEEQLRAQFPKELEGEAVRHIHHSTLRKDELVTKVQAVLRPARSGEDDAAAAASGDGAADAGISKRLVTHFLIYVADKQKPGVWVCKEPWVRKYSLAADLPEGLRPPAAPAAGGDASAAPGTPMRTPAKGSVAAAAGAGAGSGSGEAPPVRTLEEEEARLRPGSLKAVAFKVMKARGAAAPVSADDIVRLSVLDGSKLDWPDANRRSLSSLLNSDHTFVRAARGLYTLRCLAPELAAASGGAKGGSAEKPAKAPSLPKPAEAGADKAAGEHRSSLETAERALAAAQRAVAERRAEADKAAELLAVCQKRLAEGKAEAKAKSKASPAKADASGAAGPSPSKEELDAKFALPPALCAYTGPDDDRKAKSAWRQEKAREEKRLAAEREAYVQQQRLAEAKAAKAGTELLQASADRAKKAAEDANAKLGRALKAEADAQRAIEREKQRDMLRDIKEKNKADKEKQKQADREERERRRAEALAAKRYPIDDLELLGEELAAAAGGAAPAGAEPESSAAAAARSGAAAPAAPDAAAPAGVQRLDVAALADAQHLDAQASQRLGLSLYVADTLSQFAKQLGVKGCSQGELLATLEAASAGAALGADAGAADARVVREALRWLGTTYQQLLTVLIEDIEQQDGAARVFSRWSGALAGSAGAWPELARRWVSIQEQDRRASPEALAVAEHLHTHDAGSLSVAQHLALLAQLLDDCLDTTIIRGVLNHRIEEAQELAAGVRAELAEGRKKLRELADAEKESRKRKRAAALALATAAAERQLREAGKLPAAGEDGEDVAAAAAPADAGVEGEDAAAAAAASKEQAAKQLKAKTKGILDRAKGLGASKLSLAELEAELGGEEEAEPSWQLPAELREYSGPPGDKKAMSEFRRKQQEKRKQLDKDKAKWHAGKAKRAKARAEAKKKEAEEERVLTLERKKAEAALAEQQERLEQQLERYLVRRQPLGCDRFNRAYWWGLAGNKSALLVQQEVGGAEATLGLLQEAAARAAAAAAAAAGKGGAGGEPSPAGKPASPAKQQQQQEQSPAARPAQPGGEEQAADARLASAGPDAILQAPLQHKGLLLPPGPEGWALLEAPPQLEALLGSLEVKGVRERELKASVDKMLPSMTAAIEKAAAAREAAAAGDGNAADEPKKGAKGKAKRGAAAEPSEQPVVLPRALPSRHARSVAAEQIRQSGTVGARGKEEAAAAAAAAAVAAAAVGGDDDDAGAFHGWQLAAAKSAVRSLGSVAQAASAAKFAPPPGVGSWSAWGRQLEELLQGEVPEEWAQATSSAALQLLTGGAAAGDAAWARAIAAASSTPAEAAASGDAASDAARHAALAHLRLQLLACEQQLAAATGEAAALCGCGGSGSWEADGEPSQDAEDEESSEGEASDPVAGPEQQPAAMDVDAEEQQQEQQEPAAGAAKGGRGGRKGGRGLKRAASSSDALADAEGAAAGADAAASEPPRKRARGGQGAAAAAAPAAKGKGAAAGLPPRPSSRNKARGDGAGEAGAAPGSLPASREGSLAPAGSGALPAAAAAAASAGKRGAKRGRSVAEADSADGEADEAAQQGRRGAAKQQQRGGAKAQLPSVAADSTDVDERSEEPDEEQQEQQRGGRRPAHLRALQLQEGGDVADPDEDVAEEADCGLPARLRGKTVWLTREERESWRACVAAAATASGLAYHAAVLAFHAAPPLAALAKRAGGKAKAPAPAAHGGGGGSGRRGK